MEIKIYTKNLFILSLLSVFSFDLHAMTQDQSLQEESIQIPSKKQKTLDWEIDCTTNEDAVIINNSEGDQITYRYHKTPLRPVFNVDYLKTSQEDFCCDSTGQWMCLLIDYIEADAHQVREYVLINPTIGTYIKLDHQPLINHNLLNGNEYLLIDPVTFIPFFSQPDKQPNWIINDRSEKLMHFLTDGYGNQLLDAHQRTYFVRKLENKESGDVIYSLHVTGPEGDHSINLSHYLKRDHQIIVEKCDTHARFLNLEDKQSLLIYVTDQQTGERSQFGIDLLDIKNQHTPREIFWRADQYSYTAPIITEKNGFNWHEFSHQDLMDKDGVPIEDAKGNRFVYRQIQRRLDGDGLGTPLSCLYVVDRNGQESGINLGYYLDRDFDSQPTAELTHVRLCGKGKFLQFSTGDNHWALEVSDLKDLKKGTIYSPLMCLNRVINHTNEYTFSDFIKLNLERSECHGVITYGKQVPVYLTVFKGSFENYKARMQLGDMYKNYSDETLMKRFEKDMTSQLTLFPRDQLRCRDTIAFRPAWHSQNSLQKKVEEGFIPKTRMCWDLMNRYLYLPSNIKHFEQEKNIENIDFDTRFLFPEKVIFRLFLNTASLLGNDLIIKDLSVFLGPIIDKNIPEINDKDRQLINQIFSNQFIEGLQEDIEYLSDYDKLTFKNTIGNFLGNIYSEEFKPFLLRQNWSSISNKDCLLVFQAFDYLVNYWNISIDLKNQEYFISKREYFINEDEEASSDESEDMDEGDENNEESDNEEDDED